MRLLAMLEPMVRPGNLPGPSDRLLRRSEAAEAGLPLEQRSFEALLDEAREQAAAHQTQGRPMQEQHESEAVAPARTANPLTWLGRTDWIENASVRGIRSQGSQAQGPRG